MDSDQINVHQADGNNKSPVMLILVGLIGSGKSSFAQALEEHYPETWKRCNQDDLGSRQAVEQLAREYLSLGYSVCIDRTNVNASQRAHWVDIAHDFPGISIWVIVFDIPYETCALRLKERRGHPTIQDPELALQILSRFASEFSKPTDDEGYNRIMFLTLPDVPVFPRYSPEEVARILEMIRQSPPIDPCTSGYQRRGTYNPRRSYFSGGWSRGTGNQWQRNSFFRGGVNRGYFRGQPPL